MDSKFKRKVLGHIDNIELKNNLQEVSSIKPIKWFKNYFRLRIWDYRLWFKYENNTVTLLRLRHRKDIYKIFP